jgi:hypothetical protein
VDANDTAGVDFEVMPQSNDRFVLPDGTAMNNGQGLINNDARHNQLTVECFDPNVWTVTSWGHSWAPD